MAPSASATGARKTHYGLVANAAQKHGSKDKSSSVERTTRSRGMLDGATKLNDMRCTKCRERGVEVCTTSGSGTRRTSCDQCVEIHRACSLTKRKAAEMESSDEQEDDGDDATAPNNVAPLKPALRHVRSKDSDSDNNSGFEIGPPPKPTTKPKPKPKPKSKPAMRSGDNSGGSATPAKARTGLVSPTTPRSKAKVQGKPEQAGVPGRQRRSHGVIVASAFARPGVYASSRVVDGATSVVEDGGGAVSSGRLELLQDARDAFFEKVEAARGEVAGEVLDRLYLKAKAWMDAEELVLGA